MLSHWLTVLDKDPQSIAQLVKSQLVAMATEVRASPPHSSPQTLRMPRLRMPHCLRPKTHMLIVFLPDYYSMLGPLHLIAPLTSSPLPFLPVRSPARPRTPLGVRRLMPCL
jgi:hypothetical protein